MDSTTFGSLMSQDSIDAETGQIVRFVPWEDLEGLIVMTMLSGQTNVQAVELRLYVDGLENIASLVPAGAPVPLPSAMVLLASGLGGFAVLKRGRR